MCRRRGAAAASERRFEQLLRALGRPVSEQAPQRESLEAAIERLYGAPLSGRDGETDSLEWRFLAWLAKRR